MKKALCIFITLLTVLALVSCGETVKPKVCFVKEDGAAIDITTGEVFANTENAANVGYYVVAADGTIEDEAEIKTGVITSITIQGKAVGFEGKVVFIEDGIVSDKKPWGVEYCELYEKMAVKQALYQTNPTVTFSYIEIDGTNYVLVDTIKVN